MTIKTKTYTGRQLRRMQAKAKPRPSKFHKNAMGASALFSQLAMCRPADAGPIPGDGSDLAGYANHVRTKSINNVRAALLRMTEGTTDCLDDITILAEAMGVSVIRAAEIAGNDASTNPLLAALQAGQQALNSIYTRHEKWGKWEMIAAEKDAVNDAIDLYVEVMTNSTPQQMEDAMGTRRRMIELARR